ncbi:MAG TPA: PDC sensor domain-containing protein, partial [Vicinamibacteria bacterium]|nr:PDC sensor domain-containing protein [Vicinamibacteria bacterium]
LALAAQADTTPVARVKETAYARVAHAQAIAGDAAIKAAVLASNQVAEPPEQIKRRDDAWIANPHDPLRQVIVRAPCSGRVRDLVKDDAVIVEAFVMNDRGTLVCSITETSDYWQGDEAKWQRTFTDGRDPFVEEPAFDASSGTYAIQVSVPISDKGKRIGAVTLTLKLHHSEAAAAHRP